MNFNDLYTTLERSRYYIFSIADILSFYPKEKRQDLKGMLYRWRKKGWIYMLKRGLYELAYPKDYIIPDMHIANKLYSPSYVSLETALSNYSIIPEVSMAVTSITTKPTRRFKNRHGLFNYHTVKPDAFTGYYVERQNNSDILIAEPEKALVDFLYFKTYRNKAFKITGERMERNIIEKLSRVKLKKYAKLYHLNIEEILYANI
jgi:predicted transcriptional regulator of viral defense system